MKQVINLSTLIDLKPGKYIIKSNKDKEYLCFERKNEHFVTFYSIYAKTASRFMREIAELFLPKLPDYQCYTDKCVIEDCEIIPIEELLTKQNAQETDKGKPCNCDKGQCVKSKNYYRFCKYTKTIVDPEYLHG